MMDIHNKSITTIINNLSDALMIMDGNGKIKHFNDVASQITGYTCLEARSMKCKDILKTTCCDINCLFNNKKPTQKSYTRKLEITRKDGTKAHIECTRNILIDSHNFMFGAVETFKDIAQIKCLQDSLEYSELKYRRLFESSMDMMFIISLEGQFLDINQAMVDLLDYKDKNDLYLLEHIEGVFIDPIHWRVCKKQLHLNGFIRDFEVGFKKKDGVRLHGCLSANVFLNDDGEIIGYEGIAKDITARMDAFSTVDPKV